MHCYGKSSWIVGPDVKMSANENPVLVLRSKTILNLVIKLLCLMMFDM